MATALKSVSFYDRKGFDARTGQATYLTWGNASLNSILGGLILKGSTNVGGQEWGKLQPTDVNSNGTADLNAAELAYIDGFFNQCDAYNNTNPVLHGTTTPLPWTAKMRVFAGEYAPTWAQNLNGGPVTGSGPSSGCWWATVYISAWLNFQSKLASHIPNYTVRSSTSSFGLPVGPNTHALKNHPLLGSMVLQPTMTAFAETMMIVDFTGGWNSWTPNGGPTGPLAQPYTATLQQNALSGTFTTAPAIWGSTPLALSHNPFDTATAGGKSEAEATTESLMTSFINASTWPAAIIENNSLRFAHGSQDGGQTVYPPPQGAGPYKDAHDGASPGNMTSMYTKMTRYAQGQAMTDLGLTALSGTHPVPMCIQTASMNQLSLQTSNAVSAADLANTIEYAIWLGAMMVELPSTYETFGITLAQWAAWAAALMANDPTTSGGVTTWQATANADAVASGSLVITNLGLKADAAALVSGQAVLTDVTGVTGAYIGGVSAVGVASVTPSYTPAGGATGHLLSALVTSHCTTPSTLTGTSAATTGWSLRQGVYPGSVEVSEIWEKIALGSDVMPTWNFASGTASCVTIAEFSGTTLDDQTGTGTGTTGPTTGTNSGVDGGTGRLVVFCNAYRQGTGGAITVTDNVNGQGAGVGVTVLGDTTGLTQASHQSSGYSLSASTGSGFGADTEATAITAGNAAQHIGVAIASYKATVVVQTYPLASDVVGKSGGSAAFSTRVLALAGDLIAKASGGLFVSEFTPPVAPPSTIGLLPTRQLPLNETKISDNYAHELETKSQIHVISKAEIWLNGKREATFQITPSGSSLTVDRANLCRRNGTLTLTEGVAVDDKGNNVQVVPTNIPLSLGGALALPVPGKGASVASWRAATKALGGDTADSGIGPQNVFVPYGAEVKVYSGLQYDDGVQEYKLMLTGPMEDVVVDDTEPNLVVTLDMYDRAKSVQRAGFTNNWSFPKNVEVGAGIKLLLSQLNLPFFSTLKYNFHDSRTLTPKTPIIYRPGDDPMQACVDAATACGFEFFFDPTGGACFLPILDPTTATVSWYFNEDDPNILLKEASRTLSRTNAPNFIIRYGTGSGAAVPVRAQAVDTNPKSNMYWLGSYGRQLDPQSSPFLITKAQCQTAANAALMLSKGSVDAIVATSFPRCDSDVDNVFAVKRARAGIVNELYVIDQIQFTFGTDGQQIATARSLAAFETS